jgi:hypothetical protein
LERDHPRFRFVPTLTRTDKNYRGWKGETHQPGNAAHTRENLARPDLLHSWAPDDGCRGASNTHRCGRR